MYLSPSFRHPAFSFALSLALPATLLAQPSGDCRELDAVARSRVRQVAARQFRTEPALPQIEKETRVSGTCYMRVLLSVPGSNRHMQVYVSPDRQYLFPMLWDLSIDPQGAEEDLAARLKREADALKAPSLGPASAPVTVVVFSDFQCPFCASFSAMVTSYRADKPDAIRLLFRNLPLAAHEWAAPAARTGVCIAQQSPAAFWRFHDRIFSQQKLMSPAQLVHTVEQFISGSPELSASDFAKCMASSYPAERVERDALEGRDLEIHGTPAVFINGRRYAGFRDEAAFAAAVGLALGSGPAEEVSEQ